MLKPYLLSLSMLVMHAAVGADCIDSAAEAHAVNSNVLRAIGWHESRLRSKALSPANRDSSRDYGAFQLNDAVLRDFGLTPAQALDGCLAAMYAARHLANQMKVHGNTWEAVGAYHSPKTKERRTWYANQIIKVLKGWEILPPSYQAIPGPMLAPNQPNPKRR